MTTLLDSALNCGVLTDLNVKSSEIPQRMSVYSFGGTASNSPCSNTGILIHFKLNHNSDTLYAVQVAFEWYTNYIYTRSYNRGAWTEWTDWKTIA
jgi:hypothetical protein